MIVTMVTAGNYLAVTTCWFCVKAFFDESSFHTKTLRGKYFIYLIKCGSWGTDGSKTGSRSCWWLERYRTDTHTQFCVFQAAASLQPFQCSQRCESVDSQQGRQKKCVLLHALHTLVMVWAPGGHREDFEWENSSQLHVPPPSAVPRAVSQWALDSMDQGLLSFTGALPQPITMPPPP